MIFTIMMNCLLSAIVTTLNPSMNQQPWKTFDDRFYTIKYPGSWELNTSGANNTSFILIAGGTENQPFRENINLIISKLPDPTVTIDFFAKASEQQIASNFEDSELIESTRVRTQKSEYQKMIYTGTKSGIDLKFTQHYWVIDGVAFVLTFSANRDKWDEYATEVEQIFQTLTFKFAH